MSPLISVIIPAYNRGQMLRRAVQSVLAQDYASLEIIIVDDASTDDTAAIVQSLKDGRICYVRQAQNKGAAAARNTGMQKARGEYFAFLDADDEFLPARWRRLVDTVLSLTPRPGFIFTNAFELNAKGEKTTTVSQACPTGYVTTRSQFPASVFTPTSCWMLHRDICQDEFFDENIYTIEDCDFFARIVRKCPSYFFNEPLTLKHIHGEAQGRVPIQHAESTRERMLQKWLPEMKKDRRFLVNFYCTMAKDLLQCGKRRKAVDVLIRALLIAPFNFKVLGKLWKAYGLARTTSS